MANKSSEENSSIGSKSNNSHSRQGSDICQTSSSGFSDIRQTDIGNCVQGSIVGLHRKMVTKVKLHILWIGKDLNCTLYTSVCIKVLVLLFF